MKNKLKITRKRYQIPGGWCTAFNPNKNKKQSIAIVEQNGRYPKKGFALNFVCIETIFVLEGRFKVEYERETFWLEKSDVFYLEPGNRYAITGKGKNLVAVTPAWDKSQAKTVK